jgi:methyl-accepting chemotaxis protein
VTEDAKKVLQDSIKLIEDLQRDNDILRAQRNEARDQVNRLMERIREIEGIVSTARNNP